MLDAHNIPACMVERLIFGVIPYIMQHPCQTETTICGMLHQMLHLHVVVCQKPIRQKHGGAKRASKLESMLLQ